ncbi:hypothetical protein NRF20_06170 [Streptomyces sp. R-74717]|uniref:hypothetical protein n=1 Tax=Streptomyces TaxID=1883 RepID=UPI0037A64EE4
MPEPLWLTRFDGSTWTPDDKFNGTHLTGAGPALIAYRDKNGTQDHLLCVHRGRSSS